MCTIAPGRPAASRLRPTACVAYTAAVRLSRSTSSKSAGWVSANGAQYLRNRPPATTTRANMSPVAAAAASTAACTAAASRRSTIVEWNDPPASATAVSLRASLSASLANPAAAAPASASGSFGSAKGRVFNFFCFFTVQSNFVVAITSALLAVNLHRPSTVFRVFRLVGVIAIAVTGVVFYVALKGLHELTGWDALADFLLHTASPILSTLGW